MNEVYSPRTRKPVRLTRETWTEICLERFSIMTVDGGMDDSLAKAAAYQDTTARFGPRPREVKP